MADVLLLNRNWRVYRGKLCGVLIACIWLREELERDGGES